MGISLVDPCNGTIFVLQGLTAHLFLGVDEKDTYTCSLMAVDWSLYPFFPCVPAVYDPDVIKTCVGLDGSETYQYCSKGALQLLGIGGTVSILLPQPQTSS